MATPNTHSQAKPVIQLSLQGEFIAEFESMAEASRKTFTNERSIYKYLKGISKQAGGYLWKYRESEVTI